MLLWLKKFVRRQELSNKARFCESFQAIIEDSPRRFRRTKPLPDTWWKDVAYTIGYEDRGLRPELEIEDVKAVAIHLPEENLSDLLRIAATSNIYKEIEIRNNVPAVKKAWEQYQLLLKMCGGDY